MSDASTAGALGALEAPPATTGLRVGVDVGGTFTKAVALDPAGAELRAQAVVPTTHASAAGVTEGVVEALRELLGSLDGEREEIGLVAFSTTQAMNALLEGDVATVGVIGLGAAPDLRVARRRTKVGDIALAPGRALRTEHEFLDVTDGLEPAAIDAALGRLAGAGCTAVAVSGAFAVDAPDHEVAVVERAARMGLPACAGHDLSGAYGLETRTVSASINAAILPVVERTATLVRRGLRIAGVRAPLLVLRGDGGAMGVDAFRRRPSFTVGSGPAAGVAAALHRTGVTDAIVVECGGTSTNVSVIKGGRPVLRTIKVMGRPTAIRSIDSWVVGAAGGSMPLLGRRGIAETGPRSAHLAGFEYACFAEPEAVRGATLERVSPREGDPGAYAAVRSGERRFAVTATCAANALGLVEEGTHAHGSQEAALAAFAALAPAVRARDPERAARAVLDGALEKIGAAVADAARAHELPGDVPLVALGGAAEALVPELARRLGHPVVRPGDAEILSSIGAAVSLIRAEVTRAPAAVRGAGTANGQGPDRIEVVREAQRACVEAGAAPGTVAVETSFDADEGVVRAVATGAVALEAGAAARRIASQEVRRAAAAAALGLEANALEAISRSDFYELYAGNGNGQRPVAVVDALGTVAIAEDRARVVTGESDAFIDELSATVEDASLNLGVTAVLPRVTVLAGPTLLDLSDARRSADVRSAAQRAIAEHPGPAAAVVAR
ncbi:MAG: hydantoinase/oxoprolinase family protein [Solirubrobacterales bacterium]